MSTAEPVSAFGAFRLAKGVAESKKKSKQSAKHENKIHNGTGKVNKMASSTEPAKEPTNTKKQANHSFQKKTKAKNANTYNPKSPKQQNKANPAAAKYTENKNKPQKFKDSEVVGLVEQLMGDPSKKLSKSKLQKKQELEEYLVKQLERDEITGSQEDEDDDDFDSESGSEEESDEYTDSNEFSDEYTINESGSYSEDAEDSNGSPSEGEILTQSKNNNRNKRKGLETPAVAAKCTKTPTANTNGVSEAKKARTASERKSLSADKAEGKSTADENKRRKSLDQGKTGNARKVSIATASVKLEPLSPPHNTVSANSIAEGKRAFKWLINPVKVEDFFSKYWESQACLIKRQQSSYFSHLISFEGIDQMLIKNHVEFTKNIDVTSYKNGVRETLNPEGRAMPPVVWDHYGQGCSIRLLNPQTFLPNLYTLSATMQEYFHCLVGANAYLTPPNSQGFAPHYDDIEAFVLQIEGRKRWKLYKPRNASDILPRFSSKNFEQTEIGKPILEEVLEPGDVLYFPRGTIHQACTEPGYHSLHITLSVYQKQSFADLFEKMMPLMLQKAIASNVELRRGLPLHTWQHAGVAFSIDSSKERTELLQKVTKLMQKCIKEMPLKDIVDAAVDQVAKKFQHEALPPDILPSEKLRTVFGSRSRTNQRGECICDYDIDERTNVRLLRANILRLLVEEENIRIYYYLDNSKEYCEYEPNFIEIEAKDAASVEVLIKSYPSYIGVSQLPLSSDEQKINLVTALWERGLLMMEKPFK